MKLSLSKTYFSKRFGTCYPVFKGSDTCYPVCTPPCLSSLTLWSLSSCPQAWADPCTSPCRQNLREKVFSVFLQSRNATESVIRNLLLWGSKEGDEASYLFRCLQNKGNVPKYTVGWILSKYTVLEIVKKKALDCCGDKTFWYRRYTKIFDRKVPVVWNTIPTLSNHFAKWLKVVILKSSP